MKAEGKESEEKQLLHYLLVNLLLPIYIFWFSSI